MDIFSFYSSGKEPVHGFSKLYPNIHIQLQEDVLPLTELTQHLPIAQTKFFSHNQINTTNHGQVIQNLKTIWMVVLERRVTRRMRNPAVPLMKCCLTVQAHVNLQEAGHPLLRRLCPIQDESQQNFQCLVVPS